MSDFQRLNSSEFQGNPMEEVDGKQLEEAGSPLHDYLHYVLLYISVMDLAKFVLSVVATSAYFFLAVTICRFKELTTRTNMYVVNMSVMNVIYFINHYVINNLIPDSFAVVLIQTQSTVLVLYIIFAFALGVDWFVSAVRPNCMEKYHKFYKIFFLEIYSISFIDWCLATVHPEMNHAARSSFYTVVYGIALICQVILNVLKRNTDLRKECGETVAAFTAANIAIFSFAPLFIYGCLVSLATIYEYGALLMIVSFAEFIPDFIACGHPVLVVYMLGKRNEHFKIAYRKSFRLLLKNYDADNLEEGDTEIEKVKTEATSYCQAR